ncbi:MAG: hypothetical protein ACLFTA_02975 [Candidatus Nanohaloarchaea archaeon]
MKGQVSLEFFIYFSVMMIVLAVLFTNAADKQVETFDYRETTRIDAVASKVAFEVENAQAYGTGYERNFSLPREVFGDSYTVNVSDSFAVAESESASSTATPRYTGRDVSLKSENGPFTVFNNGSVHVVPQ